MEETNQCILVMMDATVDGKKDPVTLTDGVSQIRAVVERRVAGHEAAGTEAPSPTRHRRRCARILEDAAAGICSTCEQRCWVHETTNVLNKLPKHLQPKAQVYTGSGWPRRATTCIAR